MSRGLVRIIARLNVGGPARHCLLLHERLRTQGYDTALWTGALDAGEALIDGGDDPTVERVPGLQRAVSPREDARALAWLVRALRRRRPAIVHTHTAKAGALGRVAARIARVPVVVHTFHGHVLAEYFSPRVSRVVQATERRLARWTSRLVTLSEGLKRDLVETYRIAPAERVEVVPLGRDLAPFRAAERGALRRELGVGEDVWLIGAVGRHVPIKDLGVLLRAVARLPERAHAVLVGDGPERGALEAEAARLGLGGRAHFLGWRSDLPALYADVDVVALSSRTEGTPLAVIEGFAAGAPAVAPAVGGIPDMFTGVRWEGGVGVGSEGALVRVSDVGALARGLRVVLEDPERRVTLSEGARVASRRYDAERLVEALDRLYLSLLG